MKKDDLAQYREMRDFAVTSEPRGKVAARRETLTYVIQRHDARNLHFDFRLELDGVLKSWAVPKGPSLVAGEKRLAMQVEDHPLDYGHFEGSIPKGHYGAGHVLLWDQGTWIPKGDPHEGLEKGRLSFTLEGKRLHGGFALVRMKSNGEKKNAWLLLKENDAFAASKKLKEVTEAEPPPNLESFHPQLCTLETSLPTGEGWILEPKFDGYRALSSFEREGKTARVQILSRTGQDWTTRFANIRDALAKVDVTSAVFDGEVCALDEQGRPDFQRLQNILSAGSRDALVYFIFDLLFVDGFDIRTRPLETRKAILQSVLEDQKPPLVYVGHLEARRGSDVMALACQQGLEGIVAKRKSQPYRPRRSREWVKVKCHKRQEMVVLGYTAPKGGRTALGALLLGVHDEDGKLHYACKVGTGFSATTLVAIGKKLAKMAIDRSAAVDAPRIRDATWVRPQLVAEISFTEWTSDGALRHPVFVGLREDKKPEDVVRERPGKVTPAKRVATLRAPSSANGRTVAKKMKSENGESYGVRITHPDRVVDQMSGLTKLELARYYEAVADRFLLHGARRPLALVRCPEGSDGECFFQKQRAKGMPDTVLADKVGKHGILYIEKPQGLLALIQFGAMELHGWGSRIDEVSKPDQIVMDLDPDVGLPFERVIEAAKHMREVWKSLALQSFVKTTGGKGLHVVVPITPRFGFDEVKTLTHAVAEQFAREEPEKYTAVMSKASRHGKIFIDYLRNGDGATAILPYSTRARPGATVAMPIAWRDLGKVDPQEFTARSVPQLLYKKDPWAEFFSLKQGLPDTLATAIQKRR